MNTLYIDVNRQNSSIKDDTNNNEWTYKLSNPLNLPPGSSVQIQDTFINKKGISGQSVEINEDIEEEISYGYYLSDNPHFVPQTYYNQIDTQPNGAFIDTFVPMGSCNYNVANSYHDDNALNLCDGVAEVYGGHAINQRADLFKRHRFDGTVIGAYNPFYNNTLDGVSVATDLQPQNGYIPTLNRAADPRACGYTELPMCAVRLGDGVPNVATDVAFNGATDGTNNYHTACPMNGINNVPFANGNQTNTFQDIRIEPLIETTKIFIPKGVYAVSEIAQLIEDQIRGVISADNVKNGDYYNGNLNSQENGDLDNGGIYKKVRGMNFYGSEYITGVDATIQITDAGPPQIQNVERIGSIFNNPYQFSPILGFNGQLSRNLVPQDGRPNGITADNKQQFWNGGVKPGRPKDTDRTIWNSQQEEFVNGGGAVNNQYCNLSQFPARDMIMYIPVHRYNQLIKFHKYSRQGYFPYVFPNDVGTAQNRNDEDYRKFRYAYQRYISTNGIQGEYPQQITNPQNVAANLKVQPHYFPFSRQPHFIEFAPNDYRVGFSKDLIGLHTIRETQSFPMSQSKQEQVINGANYPGGLSVGTTMPQHIGTYQHNYSYGIQKNNGYYLGTPDFKFTYDQDKNGFSISNLHQSKRQPSMNMYGNSYESEGSECVFMRRPADLVRQALATTQQKMEQPNTIVNNEDALTTDGGFDGNSEADADLIHKSHKRPETRVGGIMIYNWAKNVAIRDGDIDLNNGDFTTNATDYMRFQDFFTTTEKAKTSWNKTLWAKLGFTYDNLQNDTGFEKVFYYNQADADGTVNTNYQNSYNFHQDDFTLYGKTTDASLDISLAPTISTAYAGKQFDISGKSINKVVPIDKENFSDVRTYDNNDVSTPYNPKSSEIQDGGLILKANDGTTIYDNNYNSYLLSNYQMSASYPIQTSSLSISATDFPTLSSRGYFLITSDIIDGYNDEVKQGQPIPLLGVVPISNLSNQDFITTKNTITHTLSQQKIINQVKIKILNPDLTNPLLEENSSVILQVNIPIQQTPAPVNNEGDKKPKADKDMVKDK